MRKKGTPIILVGVVVIIYGLGVIPTAALVSEAGGFEVTSYPSTVNFGVSDHVSIFDLRSGSYYCLEGEGIVNSPTPWVWIKGGWGAAISFTTTSDTSYAGRTISWKVKAQIGFIKDEASFSVTFATVDYTLTSSVSPSGSGTVSPSSGTFGSGSRVTLMATPSSRYTFYYWSGIDVWHTPGEPFPYSAARVNPITFDMYRSHSVIAHFSTIPTYTLTTYAAQGSGTIARSPDKTSYDEGEEVWLTAAPSTGYSFAGWVGDLSGTTNPKPITMSKNMGVGANFEIRNYTLTLTATPSWVGTVAGGGTYNAGGTATISATATSSDYEFSYWSGDASGSQNPRSVTMDGHKSVTAHFEETTVMNEPPTANFSHSPLGPIVGETTNFTDLSTDSDGTITSRVWTFGLGASPSFSTEMGPSVVYSTAGTKTVTLVVTDDDGATGERSKTITVTEPPVGTFKLTGYVIDGDTKEGISGATVKANGFTDTTNASGYYEIKGLANGTYQVLAEKGGYIDTAGGATISGADASLLIEMEATGVNWLITLLGAGIVGVGIVVTGSGRQKVSGRKKSGGR